MSQRKQKIGRWLEGVKQDDISCWFLVSNMQVFIVIFFQLSYRFEIFEIKNQLKIKKKTYTLD